jgi:predicted nuclease of predicted toxin-antitoxin system
VKIMVDENIPAPTVVALRSMGHDVRDVRGTPCEGSTDETLWALAQTAGRLLVTTDKSFASRRGVPHSGVLLVRMRQPNWRGIPQRVLEALAGTDEGAWPGLVVSVRDTVMSRRRAREQG